MRKEETPDISLPSPPHGCVEDSAVCKQGERSHQKAPLRQAPGVLLKPPCPWRLAVAGLGGGS